MKFESREEIEEWLREKNRHDYAVVLAARAALRGIATFDLRLSRSFGQYRVSSKRARIMLFAFRAAAASWPWARYPSARAEFAHAATAALTTGPFLHFGGGGLSQAGCEAGGGFERAAATAEAQPDHAFHLTAYCVWDMACAAREIAERAHAPGDDAYRAVFDDFSADAAMLENGTAPEELAALPLWLRGAPESAMAAWKRLSSALCARKEKWEVWIDWYDARLSGRSYPRGSPDYSFLSVPNPMWEKGPTVVNIAMEQINENREPSVLSSEEAVVLLKSLARWNMIRAPLDWLKALGDLADNLKLGFYMFGGASGVLFGGVSYALFEQVYRQHDPTIAVIWGGSLPGMLCGLLVIWSHRAKEIAAGNYEAAWYEERIAARPRVTAILHLVSWAALGAFWPVFMTLGVIGLAIYPLPDVAPPDTLYLVGIAGASAGFLIEFQRQFGARAKAGSGKLTAYVRAGVNAAVASFGLIVLCVAITSFSSKPLAYDSLTELLEIAVCASGFFAICGIGKRAFDEKEFRPLAAVYVFASGALLGTIGLSCIEYLLSSGGVTERPPFTSIDRMMIIGAVVGGGFNYWRKFIRPPNEPVAVSIDKALDLTSDLLSRGKLVALHFIWVIIGLVVLAIDWWLVFDILPPNQWIPRLIVVFLATPPGIYWLGGRGVAPAWKAARGPKVLAESDYVHGTAPESADIDAAARAARGENNPR